MATASQQQTTCSRVPSGSINFISDYKKHSPEAQQLDEDMAAQTVTPHQNDSSQFLG